MENIKLTREELFVISEALEKTQFHYKKDFSFEDYARYLELRKKLWHMLEEATKKEKEKEE